MMIKICNNILKLRKEQEMTQAQVAEYLGVSPQAVSRWEQEQAMPDIFLIPKIAFLFGVSIDVLFGTSNIETSELLVSKYSVIRNDTNYKEAKEALDTLLEMNPNDLNALGLLCHLQYQRALEYLDKSKEACRILLETSDDEMWTKRANMQMMRFDAMYNDYNFIDKYMRQFEADQTVDNFNYLLVALGERHQYDESLRWAEDYLDIFNQEDQQKIYPNLMEVAYVKRDIEYADLCFHKIVDKNPDKDQVFNAWWLLYKVYHANQHEKTEALRLKLIQMIDDLEINDYRKEDLLNRIHSDREDYKNCL